MPQETPTARELARSLIKREPVRQDAADPVAAAAQAACEQFYWNLSRWLGHAGSTALFERALLSAQKEHGILADVRVRVVTAPRLDDVGDVVQTGKSSVPAEAWEALLVALIELLARFIGAEVVMRLVHHGRSKERVTF